MDTDSSRGLRRLSGSIKSPPHADVAIVGAGPAGITAALTLESAGRSVVLVESGGFTSSHWAQELNDGDYRGEPYEGLICTRHRQVGGAANLWNIAMRGKPAAKYVPLTARDLTGWPIDWVDLEPHYFEAQKVCGLGVFDYGADGWATGSCRPLDLEGTGLTTGVYQFGPATQFTRTLASRLREAENILLLTPATAVGLIVDKHARLQGVRVVHEEGEVLEVRARAVVLACGAVENARLLLLAGLAVSPSSGWLGRGFMEHARDFSLVLFPDSPKIFSKASFYDLHASEDGTWIGGRLMPTDAALDAFDLPNASMTLIPREHARFSRITFERVFRRARGTVAPLGNRRYGWSRTRAPERRFDAFKIVLNLEHEPHPENRIELCNRSDRFGNPLPRLLLRWTDPEQARLERFRGLLGEWFRAARLGHLLVAKGQRPNLSAHHHAGTTRMGLSPEDGVVDSDGRVFGFEGLYVTGASVFPTAGFANPTLTVVALALRLARHIDALLK